MPQSPKSRELREKFTTLIGFFALGSVFTYAGAYVTRLIVENIPQIPVQPQTAFKGIMVAGLSVSLVESIRIAFQRRS